MLPGECGLSARPVTEHWVCEDTSSEFRFDFPEEKKENEPKVENYYCRAE